ncbi:MAG: hypothetical protein M3346_02470 [Actinomycetota bacterium]|nr:hypothetical protein [Actinomycetota bacterium]
MPARKLRREITELNRADGIDTDRLVRILEVAVGVVLQIMTKVIEVVGHQLVCLPWLAC